VWLFGIWGTADLFYAFSTAIGWSCNQVTSVLRFTFRTVIVPLLLVTHVLVFRILLRGDVAK
jgi:hypothetical protein